MSRSVAESEKPGSEIIVETRRWFLGDAVSSRECSWGEEARQRKARRRVSGAYTSGRRTSTSRHPNSAQKFRRQQHRVGGAAASITARILRPAHVMWCSTQRGRKFAEFQFDGRRKVFLRLILKTIRECRYNACKIFVTFVKLSHVFLNWLKNRKKDLTTRCICRILMDIFFN